MVQCVETRTSMGNVQACWQNVGKYILMVCECLVPFGIMECMLTVFYKHMLREAIGFFDITW